MKSYEASVLDTFAAFNDLAPERFDRRELRKAGVSSSSIDALYPPNFSDLIPGIIAELEAREKKKLPLLAGLKVHASGEVLRSALADDLYFKLDEARLNFQRRQQPAFKNKLKRALREISPVQANDLCIDLWQAHWMMSHLNQMVEPAREQTCSYFRDLIDWALPTLDSHAGRERQDPLP